ncbi:CopD family protein [Derxia gummosa]|uniref:Protoporphyrinogen IX oxidase n=1 Tax=Derxia gummosa DSM 723 TaxID=1121388 RepID=A0A8B6X136_9BURK|nr:CopD family protein [Derxia gummosa]
MDTAYLWIKTFHIVFVVSWYAGLFYLPRLFVYHSLASDPVGIERLQTQERKLYWGIMTPAAVIAIALGLVMWLGYPMWKLPGNGWIHAKASLVLILVAVHVYLGKLMIDFRHGRNRHGHVFYRWLNEIPALPILIGAVALVIFKPF